jgi:hypothetical protein
MGNVPAARTVFKTIMYALARELRREVNEQIYALLVEGERAALMHAVCECRDPCAELVEVELEVYERVRNQPGRLLLLPAHARAGLLIEETKTYKIVEELASAGQGRVAGPAEPTGWRDRPD